MSDKIVRDELLRSHRYQSISNDTTKLLFVHLLLSSDHLSNAEATPTALSMMMSKPVSEEQAATLLDELAARDLIRIYPVGDKRYVHIPRSRQRIRHIHPKHPRPPFGIEDPEVRELYLDVLLKACVKDPKNSKIRELYEQVRLESGSGQTQVGRREVKRSEEIQKPRARELLDRVAKIKNESLGNRLPEEHTVATVLGVPQPVRDPNEPYIGEHPDAYKARMRAKKP